VNRYFTTPGVDPADELAWEHRSASITGEDGKPVFEQKDIEIPKSWSMLATNVVASKYFRGAIGSPQRERSVRQLVGRVVRTIAGWERKDGYFASEADAQAFEAELAHRAPHPLRLLAVLPDGLAVRDRTVAAVPRAHVPQDHEGRRRILPALADVRAVRLLADGVQLEAPDEPQQPVVHRPLGRTGPDPGGTGQRRCGDALVHSSTSSSSSVASSSSSSSTSSSSSSQSSSSSSP